MIILGIDSSTDAGGVALATPEGILGEISLHKGRSHSMTLAPMVRDLLSLAGLTLKDLGGIAVNSGPGSFTGIRIGLSLGASLALGAELPTVGISALEALEWKGRGLPGVQTLPLIRARGEEAYVRLDGEETVLSLEELMARLSREEPLLVLGDGAEAFGTALRDAGFQVPDIPSGAFASGAAATASCGLLALSGGRGGGPEDLHPNYLRRPEAELQLERKLRGGNA